MCHRLLGVGGACREAQAQWRATLTSQPESTEMTDQLHRGTDPEDGIHGEDAQEIHVNFIMVAELEFLAE